MMRSATLFRATTPVQDHYLAGCSTTAIDPFNYGMWLNYTRDWVERHLLGYRPPLDRHRP